MVHLKYFFNNQDLQRQGWQIFTIRAIPIETQTRRIQLRINQTSRHLRLTQSRCCFDDQNLRFQVPSQRSNQRRINEPRNSQT